MSLLPTLDYSARDFPSLRYRLQGLIRSVFPQWTDQSVANFGNILLESFAHVGDVLNFYQDNQAAETFWPTCVQRSSAILLGRLIDFKMSGPVSATSSQHFTVPVPTSKKVLIPEGTRLTTNDPGVSIPFRTTAYAEIPIGATSVNVDAEQAEVKTQYFVSTDEPNQEFILTHTPYLDGSATVTADDGVYTEVPSFLGAVSTSRVFVTLTDYLDRAHILCGNGLAGNVPQGQITVVYKVGGGASGNVEPGKIANIVDPLYYDDSSVAPVSTTNLEAASNGKDRMSVEEAKILGPASLKLLRNCISRPDFETAAKLTTGVARALMATANEYAGITENTGRLYVIAAGARLASGRTLPASPTQALLNTVYTHIMSAYPPTITFSFEVLSAVFKTFNFKVRVAIVKGATPSTVGAAIRTALADYFAVQLTNGVDNPDIDFGANLVNAEGTIVGEIPWSNLFNVVRDVSGIRKVDEGGAGFLIDTGSGFLRSSGMLLPVEFPKLGTIDITDMDTGAAL